MTLDQYAAVFFRDQLRAARARVLANAEDFEGVVQALERLGRFLAPGHGFGLGALADTLSGLAQNSPLARTVPQGRSDYHHEVSALLESVRVARNMAIHEGALARRLAAHSVECALIFEDALEANMKTVGNFMVRNPVEAAAWHPLSFVRQAMLTGSFSYLPVRIPGVQEGAWRLVADASLARALRGAVGQDARARMLGMSLEDAVSQNYLELETPDMAQVDTPIQEVAGKLGSVPILVMSRDGMELVGIVTAFDLL
ncbi:hypothetical protein PE066_04395 [Ramlibacter tataouinensis]|uniref:hypothetical protein n=1 Tax=Ramlibacter tataouinensis TaxID=94132 RepID=UPI0022F3968F|nr:hypothetical protein [Ramlibacter tataouinensis]WBY02785.1 hypothetical protein PE066_04395 [Ramlibacter tataouinensis]